MKKMIPLLLVLTIALSLASCAAPQAPADRQTGIPVETLIQPGSGIPGSPDAVPTEIQDPVQSEPAITDLLPPEQTEATEPPAETDSVPPSDPIETESARPEETSATEPASQQPASPLSPAFAARFPACPEDVTAVICNAPFPYGMPEATIRWNEGEYDQLCVIPRYAGTVVNARPITFTEDGEMRLGDPAYTADCQGEDVIYASLSRPEGMPAWYLEVISPDGASSGLVLDYNGRIGTPAYEFIQNDAASEDEFVSTLSAANLVPLAKGDLAAFAEAAGQKALDPWAAAETYFSQLNEIGDGAAYTLSYGHESDGAVYSFRMAKLHANYTIEAYDLDALVTGQFAIYEQIGNELGILGPDFEGELPALSWRLTGLSVFNHLLAAKEIRVTVNGKDLGTFTLSQDSFCTLIPLDLEDQIADRPLDVEVTVVSTWFGAPEDAWIDVYGGLASNISSAI